LNSSRVRRIFKHKFCDAPFLKLHVSGHVLQRLFEQLPPAKLFPNLSSLNSHVLRESSSSLSLVREFMSPELETLLIDVPGHVPTHEVEEFVGALPIEAPGLRQLLISTDHGATAFVVPLSLGKLPKLLTLAIHEVDVCLTRQTIANIQQARCLRTLTLGLRGTSSDCGGMALELNSLGHLSLSGNSLPQCTHVFHQIITPQLSHISIKYSEPASPMEITVFMEALFTSCENHGSLKKIHVVGATHSNDDGLVIPLSSSIFLPLLEFTGLLSVSFVNIGIYGLDDRFLDDIAVAWPGIQELKFSTNKCFSSNVTFAAMVSLASRCRSLENLHLTVDASQSTTMPRAQDGTGTLWPTQTALWKLHLGYTQVSEVARVPHILADVFPILSEIDLNLGNGFDFGPGFDIELAMDSTLVVVWDQQSAIQNLIENHGHNFDSDVEEEEDEGESEEDSDDEGELEEVDSDDEGESEEAHSDDDVR
jgi:hypothetical protein